MAPCHLRRVQDQVTGKHWLGQGSSHSSPSANSQGPKDPGLVGTQKYMLAIEVIKATGKVADTQK